MVVPAKAGTDAPCDRNLQTDIESHFAESRRLVAMGPSPRRDDDRSAYFSRFMYYRSAAVRIANDVVDSVAVAEPVNFSQTMPICGSFENVIATAAFGLTKCVRITVMS